MASVALTPRLAALSATMAAEIRRTLDLGCGWRHVSALPQFHAPGWSDVDDATAAVVIAAHRGCNDDRDRGHVRWLKSHPDLLEVYDDQNYEVDKL